MAPRLDLPRWRLRAAALVVALVAVSGFTIPLLASAAPSVVTVAEPAGAAPDYIFPYVTCDHAGANNVEWFQRLMFRPLYWYGLGGSAELQPTLSLASAPTFSKDSKTVTISTRGWRFANGQSVNAQSVAFFLNLWRAAPSAPCNASTAWSLATGLRSVSVRANVITLTLTGPVNQSWFTANVLAAIVPLAPALDAGPNGAATGCAAGAYGAPTTQSACATLFAQLDAAGSDSATFTGTRWQQTVDGPWKLTAFDGTGAATFAPNPSYSGPQRGTLSVQLRPYTSPSSLKSDVLAGRLDVAPIDASALPARTGTVVPNATAVASSHFVLVRPRWRAVVSAFNFAGTDAGAELVAQVYIRQALQRSMNQAALVTSVYRGYATGQTSPIPASAPARWQMPTRLTQSFSLSAATALLTSHGWALSAGLWRCARPGTAPTQCGAGINANDPLALRMGWATGDGAFDSLQRAEVAAWTQFGVSLTTLRETPAALLADCRGSLDLCSWPEGWTYLTAEPSQEGLFGPGGFNPGALNSPGFTANLALVLSQPHAPLPLGAPWVTTQAPVLFQPNPVALYEVANSLGTNRSLVVGPLGQLMPEYVRR